MGVIALVWVYIYMHTAGLSGCCCCRCRRCCCCRRRRCRRRRRRGCCRCEVAVRLCLSCVAVCRRLDTAACL